MQKITVFGVVLASLAPFSPCHSKVWYVDADGVPGITCDCMTIQACMDSAAYGDTVLVAAGTYGFVRIDGTAMPKSGIALVSESGPGVTTIDAGDSTNALECVAVEDVLVEGFTLSRGEPVGVLVASASVEVLGNVIRENSDTGLDATSDSHVEIRNNTIEDNGPGQAGGGIRCAPAWAVIEGNVIQHNAADIGGGLYVWARPVTIRNNLFIANTASGAMFEGYWGVGSAIFCSHGTLIVMSNTIIGNTALGWEDFGAQVEFRCVPGWCREQVVTFANNLVAGNPDGYGVSSISCTTIQMEAYCNDVWDNALGNYGWWCSDTTAVSGNISEDPLLCNPASGDFHINCSSPCAPGNHPDGYPCGLIGAYGVGCGGSATERTSWGAVKAMYR
jgi:hypothetical protein